MKTMLQMDAAEARSFLLKPESYCSLSLPQYFDFSKVLAKAEEVIFTYDQSKIQSYKPGLCENLNHRFLTNKNGEYSWRPMEIINPIIYAELVQLITDERNWNEILDRFSRFQKNQRIRCLRIPFEKPDDVDKSPKESIILNWWEEFEQQSVVLSLKYSSIAVTDISDCYGSIYTHTISWAIHDREIAKQNQGNKSFLGNKVDDYLQDMHNRQTNGIPQGSVLSDFLAEMILGYADLQLTEEIDKTEIQDYQILRYRDDYRIFTNTKEDGQYILMILTQVLGELNFKLNSSKTFTSDDIITSSIKTDKIAWIQSVHNATSLQKSLLIIRELGKRYPNSGSLMTAMSNFRRTIEKLTKCPNHNDSLLAILADIMVRNPKIHATAASIISKLLSFENGKVARDYFTLVKGKFDKIPNTGMLELWLQRVSWKYDPTIRYDEALCNLINGGKSNSDIWNFDWLNPAVEIQLDSTPIIDESKLESMNKIMGLDETELFLNNYYFDITDFLDTEEVA